MCSEEAISIYDIKELISSNGSRGFLKKIEVENEKNLLDINLLGAEEDIILAFSSNSPKFLGKVYLSLLNNETSDKKIIAHKGKIDFIRLSPSGKLVATASEKGTLIRIWCTKMCSKIKEFRRGSSARRIKEICFDHSEEIVLVTSNSLYMHVFYLNKENKKSKLSAFGMVSNYFGSEWSRLKIKLPMKKETFGVWKNGLKHVFYIFLKDGFSMELTLKEDPEEEEIELNMQEFEDVFQDNILNGL